MQPHDPLERWYNRAFQNGEQGAIDYLRTPAAQRLPPTEVIDSAVEAAMAVLEKDFSILMADDTTRAMFHQWGVYMRLGWWGTIMFFRRKIKRNGGT